MVFFQYNNNPGVEIFAFTQWDINNGDVQFVHLGEIAPIINFRLTDGLGGFFDSSTTVNFTASNDEPIIMIDQFTVIQGEEITITPIHITAVDPDPEDNWFEFLIETVEHGYFMVSGELSNNTGGISFNTTDIQIGNVVFYHDGSDLDASFQMRAFDGELYSEIGYSDITVHYYPVMETYSFTIQQGETIWVDRTMLDASEIDFDDLDLVFQLAGSSSCFFESIYDPGVPIGNFEVNHIEGNSIIRVVHDGSNNAPTVDIKVSDGIIESAVVSVVITFINLNDPPIPIEYGFSISEGESLLLDLTNFDASDADGDSIRFEMDTVDYGIFQYITNRGVPIYNFTRDEIVNGDVEFAHDGGEMAPVVTFRVMDDSGLHLNTQFMDVNIVFINVNDGPSLDSYAITIEQGETLLITSSMISVSDVDNIDSELIFYVENVMYGYFEKTHNVGVEITEFTMGDIDYSVVQFVHDGSNNAPSFDIKVSDGMLESSLEMAVITFINLNDPPIPVFYGFTISEGEIILLDLSNFNATDADDDVISFEFDQVMYGIFQNITHPGVSIMSFSLADIENGLIEFEHDGGEMSPMISFRVMDDSGFHLDTQFMDVNIVFMNVNDEPSLDTYELTIEQGETLLITSSMISASDVDNIDSELTFYVENVMYGYFEKITDVGMEIMDFTMEDIDYSLVKFVHDGTNYEPSFDIKVSDGMLESSLEMAVITFININDPPIPVSYGFTISEGETLSLDLSNFNATDADGDVISFEITEVMFGIFQYVADPGVSIMSFSLGDIESGLVEFEHDGGEMSPSFSFRVVDDSGVNDNTPVMNGIVVFMNVNDPPSLDKYELTIEQGQTLIITENMISASDVDADSSFELTFIVDNVEHGFFDRASNPNARITEFSVPEIYFSGIRFKHDGSNFAPSFDIKVSDGELESPVVSAIINFVDLDDTSAPPQSLSGSTLTITVLGVIIGIVVIFLIISLILIAIFIVMNFKGKTSKDEVEKVDIEMEEKVTEKEGEVEVKKDVEVEEKKVESKAKEEEKKEKSEEKKEEKKEEEEKDDSSSGDSSSSDEGESDDD